MLEKQTPTSSPTTQPVGTIEVLILHDSPSAAEKLASVLTRAGYRVNWQQAATKTEFENRLAQPNLILYYASLTNLTLPEAINYLLENNLNIPVLVVGGKSSISQAVAAIRAGAFDYLTSEELERLPIAVATALTEQSPCCLYSKCTAETQQQLQKLIAENADGILVVNEQGMVQFVNPAALQILGKTSEQLIGESLGFPVVNGDYLEVDIPQSSGEVLVAQMRVSQIQWQEANAYIVSLRDISQLKQAEEERAKLLEEAQAANRAKDQFLAILSHELRTPLNPIVGWSQLLQAGNLSQTQSQKGIKIIQRNAQLQAQLIDDILDISRIIRGKLKLQAFRVNLIDIINSALNTVRLAAQARSIQINTSLDKNVSQVQGDPTRLQQVVWNLLSNAIKFTPHGGQVDVSLTGVETTEANHPVSQAQIQIKDTGKGIEPAFLPYVFDYFRQAESAKTRSEGGLGLGLAIVRHLVELHGGRITVASPGVGQGATFTIFLPTLKTSEESASEINVSQGSRNLEGVKILVVDDDDDSINLLVFVLELENAEVQAAKSATEALTLIEQFQPNILISDIGMPDTDGYELIQRVRLSPTQGNIPAIALSAYASDSDRQTSLAAGFNRHLNKPLNISSFIETVTSLANGDF